MRILSALFLNIDLTRECLSYLEFYWIYQIYEAFLTVRWMKIPIQKLQQTTLATLFQGGNPSSRWKHCLHNFLQAIDCIHSGYCNDALEMIHFPNIPNEIVFRHFLGLISRQVRKWIVFLPNQSRDEHFPFQSSMDIEEIITTVTSLDPDTDEESSLMPFKQCTHFTLAVEPNDEICDDKATQNTFLYDRIDDYIVRSLISHELHALQYLCLDYGSDSSSCYNDKGDYMKVMSSPHADDFSLIDSLQRYCPHLKRADISSQLTYRDLEVFLSPTFTWSSIEELEMMSIIQRFRTIASHRRDGTVLSLEPLLGENDAEIYSAETNFNLNSMEIDLFACLNLHKLPSIKVLELFVLEESLLLFVFQNLCYIFVTQKHFLPPNYNTFIGEKVERLLIEYLHSTNKFSKSFQRSFPKFFNKHDYEYDEEEMMDYYDYLVEDWMELFQFSKEHPILTTPNLEKFCLFPRLTKLQFHQDTPIRFFMFFCNQSGPVQSSIKASSRSEGADPSVSASFPFEVSISEGLCSEFLLFLENLYPSGRWNISKIEIKYDHHRSLPGVLRSICNFREYSIESKAQEGEERLRRISKKVNLFSYSDYYSGECCSDKFISCSSYLLDIRVDTAQLFEEDLVGIPHRDPKNRLYYETNRKKYRKLMNTMSSMQSQFHGLSSFLQQANTALFLREITIPILWLDEVNVESLSMFLQQLSQEQAAKFRLQLLYSRYELFFIEENDIVMKFLKAIGLNNSIPWQIELCCSTYSKWERLKTNPLRTTFGTSAVSATLRLSCRFFKEHFQI